MRAMHVDTYMMGENLGSWLDRRELAQGFFALGVSRRPS